MPASDQPMFEDGKAHFLNIVALCGARAELPHRPDAELCELCTAAHAALPEAPPDPTEWDALYAQAVGDPGSITPRDDGESISRWGGRAVQIIATTQQAALRMRVTAVEGALRTLVALKDGPRDDHYEAAKPQAWETARELLYGASWYAAVEQAQGPTYEQVYQAWHGTTEGWGGCADKAAIARVMQLFTGKDHTSDL